MGVRYAFVDGRFLPEDQATIPVLDRGLMLGDGIFETVRAKDGRIEFFDGHYARFHRSAELVRMRQPYSQADLESICSEVCRRSALADASVRIVLTRGAYQVAEKRVVRPLEFSFHENFELSRAIVVDAVPDGGSGLFRLPLSGRPEISSF